MAPTSSMIGSDLTVRIISGVVLGIVALAAAWFGGIVAGIFLAILSAIIYLEWSAVTGTIRSVPPLVMPVALVAAMIAAGLGHFDIAIGIVLAALVLAAVASRNLWQPAGVAYAAALGLPILALRLAPEAGLLAVIFLFAVVWATDTGAYFAGRLIGGPKLWPAVSPKKTWAGAVGGLVAAAIAGLVVVLAAGRSAGLPLVLVAIGLSIVSQAGDLAESSLKRHFGVKDSGNIIPGHGGFMDRVDGLIFAGVAAVALGWMNGGGADLAEGLVRW